MDKPTYAVRLAELRNNKGLTQQQVAEITGLTRARLNNYEQGVREPDFDTLSRLADFFGTSTDYLFGRTDNPSPIKMIHLADLPDKILSKDYPDEEVVKLLQGIDIEKIEIVRDVSIEELKAYVKFRQDIKKTSDNLTAADKQDLANKAKNIFASQGVIKLDRTKPVETEKPIGPDEPPEKQFG